MGTSLSSRESSLYFLKCHAQPSSTILGSTSPTITTPRVPPYRSSQVHLIVTSFTKTNSDSACFDLFPKLCFDFEASSYITNGTFHQPQAGQTSTACQRASVSDRRTKLHSAKRPRSGRSMRAREWCFAASVDVTGAGNLELHSEENIWHTAPWLSPGFVQGACTPRVHARC